MALSEPDRERVRWMAGVLRIAIALDRTRQSIVDSIAVEATGAQLRVVAEVAADCDASAEVFTANNRSSLLATAAGRPVVVEVSALGNDA